MKQRAILLICGATTGLAGCKEDPKPEAEKVRVYGQVRTAWGEPFAGVEVSAGGEKATTDNLGFFRLQTTKKGPRLDVYARKPFWSTGHSRVKFSNSDEAQVVLELMPMQTTTLSDSAAGGVISAYDGVRVTFPADALADADGDSVTGMVEIQTAMINSSDYIATAPGNMRAVSGSNEVQLESFGMVEVRMLQNDQELQLSKPAIIEVPLSSMRTPGDDVALYHFDEASGIWEQEGSLELDGSVFRAEVPHMSSWNCDQPLDTQQCIRGRFVDADGDPVPELNLRLRGLDYTTSQSAMTGSDGRFCIAARVASENEIKAFAVRDGVTYNFVQTVSTPDEYAKCDGTGGSCVDLGDQVVEVTEFSCVTGVVRPDHTDGIGSDLCNVYGVVYDASGATVGYVSTQAESEDLCLSFPKGARMELTGDPNADNDPTTISVDLDPVGGTCASRNCTDIGYIPLLCGAGDSGWVGEEAGAGAP